MRGALGSLAISLGIVVVAGCGFGGGRRSSRPPPVIDVVVRGSGSNGDKIHLYYDVLASGLLVAAPDVRFSPVPDIEVMACTEGELVLGQDLADPGQDRALVYAKADLALPGPTPLAKVVLPVPAGADMARIRDLVLEAGDLYVLCTFTGPAGGINFMFWSITYVFRDVSSLTDVSVPDAVVTNDTFIAAIISDTPGSLAVNPDVLAATSFGKLHLSLDPQSLSGAETPDRTLGQIADLGLAAGAAVALGDGVAYLLEPISITAFDDPPNIQTGQPPLFVLRGTSLVQPLPSPRNRVAETSGRLFSVGITLIDGPPVVGFDLVPPPIDFAPPDIIISLPLIGEQRLASAADTLVCGQVTLGGVTVFEKASRAGPGAQPDLYLYDPDISLLEEIRVVER